MPGDLRIQITVDAVAAIRRMKDMRDRSKDFRPVFRWAKRELGLMNGQNFAFNGYIPIDASEKKEAIKNLEKLSISKNQSQIFIETPYRNNKMLEDILNSLHPETYLCVASDITLPSEYIKTMRVVNWKKTKIDLHNRPTIFIIHKM